MATAEAARQSSPSTGEPWYALDPADVIGQLGVVVGSGLSAGDAAGRLKKDGPNQLPVEQPPSPLHRFLAQYTSYMQIILVGAAIVSLVIKQWTTAIVLIVITLFNALVGLRQEGKAESAMNALQSMMKATARVRRDGVEAEIPAEQLVVGDVVLVTAGDEVPADGRIVSSSALEIDESALTGESVPATKDASKLTGGEVGPGEQSNMAFMHTPVTHGSGVVVVTATGSGTQVGKIAHMLSTTAKEETPLTKQMNTLTLWIVAAAGVTMIVMFALGAYRGQPWKMLFDTAVALAIAAIPLALPMVVQVVLSLGSVELAKQKAIVKDLPSVETLGFTSAINSDKTGTLTMNQMTAVEVVDPANRYEITGSGYGLEGKISHAAGTTETIDAAILPYVIASDAKLVDGKVVGDPTEGALLVLAYKAGIAIDDTREQLPRLATLPFDPTYKLMATFNRAKDASGRDIVRCFVKGAAPAVMGLASTAQSNGTSVPWDDALRRRAEENVLRMGEAGLRVMAGAVRDLDAAGFDPTGDLLALVRDVQMTSLVGMVDPPREESRAAVASAHQAHIRVRMVTGDDVVTGAAIAKQLDIPGEAILGADFAALSEPERLERIDYIGVVGRVAPGAQGAAGRDAQEKGRCRRHDRRRRQRRARHQGRRHRRSHGQRHRGGQKRRSHDPVRRQLRHNCFRGGAGPQAVRQPQQVHPLRLARARRLRPYLPGGNFANLAAGQPFTPAQILWVNFLVNAPFGVALGFDQESPGLMDRHPRPRGESILTTGVMITCGLVGLFVAVANLGLIAIGKDHYGSVATGQSIALVGFTLMLVVAAFEARSETETVFTAGTFNSSRMNMIAVAELAGAFLITQADFLRRLLGTTPLTAQQGGLALSMAVLLLTGWEIGKWVARRRGRTEAATVAVGQGRAR